MRALKVSIKSEQDIEKLRISGRLAAQVLQMIGEHVKPGVTTEYLDDLCHDYIVNTLKVIPANVGYHGYTKTTCISPNEVVCHGIPSSKTILKDGDIINIDVAVIKDGFYGDTSRMYYVGQVKPEAKKLVDTTYEAMRAGIHAVKPARLWAILAMPFKVWRIVKGLALCVNIADMVLGRCITNNQVCCIMVSLDKAWCLKRHGIYH